MRKNKDEKIQSEKPYKKKYLKRADPTPNTHRAKRQKKTDEIKKYTQDKPYQE